MKTSHLLLAVLGAAAAGVVVGILIAPEKGSETRKKIGEKADELKERAEELARTGREYFEDITTALKKEANAFETANSAAGADDFQNT